MGVTTKYPTKDNIYMSILEPLVQAYAYTNNPNPHEVMWAVTLLNARTQWWGGNMPSAADSRRGDPECCLEPVVPMCCKNGLVAGARADRAANPDTTRTQTLEKELRNMSMSQINAWQDWAAALGYFFDNIGPFLKYFKYKYKDGAFAKFYTNTANVIEHPQGNEYGIEMSLFQEGLDGATEAVSTLAVGGTGTPPIDPFQEGPYILIYGTATTAYKFWFSVANTYAEPTLVIPGVSIESLQIDLPETTGQTDICFNIENAINTSGKPVSAITDGTTVTITNDVSGSVPTSSFTDVIDSSLTGVWSMGFVDGAGGEDINTIFFISFALADISLADRFFILYDQAGQSYMFYYNLDGAGTFSPPVGVIPDVLTPINISTGDLQKDILAATLGVLDASNLFALSVNGLLLRVTYKDEGLIQDFNEGTAVVGINYEFNSELKGSDGSTLASGITNSEEYATAWNEVRVPFEETQGYTYPYLDPRIVGVGSPTQRGAGGTPCGACFRAVGIPVYGGDPGSGPSSDSPNGPTGCRGCTSGASASVFRAIAYNTFPTGNYNTPGNIFIASEGRQARLININDIV